MKTYDAAEFQRNSLYLAVLEGNFIQAVGRPMSCLAVTFMAQQINSLKPFRLHVSSLMISFRSLARFLSPVNQLRIFCQPENFGTQEIFLFLK